MNIEEEKYYVYTAMRKYGGSFVENLGNALVRADFDNTRRIKEAFPEYWKQYLEIGKIEWEANKQK